MSRYEQLEKLWNSRNPQHEINSNHGKDEFFFTVLAVFDDFAAQEAQEFEIALDASELTIRYEDYGIWELYQDREYLLEGERAFCVSEAKKIMGK